MNQILIYSTLFGIGILAWGLIKKSTQVRKIGTILLIVGALCSYFAFESGKFAEEQIEESRISETYGSIHDHEEAAEIAIMFSIITGGLSFLSLKSGKLNSRFKKTLHGVLVITAVLTFLTLIFTAYKGGEIRHHQESCKHTKLLKIELDL